MDRVVRAVRVGGVTLRTLDKDAGIKAAAAANLHDLAEVVGVGRLAHEA